MKKLSPESRRHRRLVLKAAAAAGIAQVGAPFVIKAQGEVPIRFGLDDPLTGTYAELGKNEQMGCEYAIDQLNAHGGILGRPVQLIVEDSTSADTGAAVQKARKLIARDKVDFLLGNVNSAMALAIGQVSNGMRSTNDAPQSKVAERVRCGSDAGQRRSAGIFQGSNAS